MADEKTTTGPLGEALSRNIQRIREDRNVTFAELARRLSDLGRPIPVLGLRRIEKDERRVDIDDLVAIARALRVPPVLLLFPLGRPDEPNIELLPGVVVDPADALAWFTGEGRMPHGLSEEEYDETFGRGRRDPASGLYEWYEDPDVSWEGDAAPVLLRRQHQRQIADWYAAGPIARQLAPDPADRADREQIIVKLQAAAVESLRALRAQMRRQRLTPPGLPDELRRLVEGEPADAGKETSDD